MARRTVTLPLDDYTALVALATAAVAAALPQGNAARDALIDEIRKLTRNAQVEG